MAASLHCSLPFGFCLGKSSNWGRSNPSGGVDNITGCIDRSSENLTCRIDDPFNDGSSGSYCIGNDGSGSLYN
jgi:hypothetical protein